MRMTLKQLFFDGSSLFRSWPWSYSLCTAGLDYEFAVTYNKMSVFYQNSGDQCNRLHCRAALMM